MGRSRNEEIFKKTKDDYIEKEAYIRKLVINDFYIDHRK